MAKWKWLAKCPECGNAGEVDLILESNWTSYKGTCSACGVEFQTTLVWKQK